MQRALTRPNKLPRVRVMPNCCVCEHLQGSPASRQHWVELAVRGCSSSLWSLHVECIKHGLTAAVWPRRERGVGGSGSRGAIDTVDICPRQREDPVTLSETIFLGAQQLIYFCVFCESPSASTLLWSSSVFCTVAGCFLSHKVKWYPSVFI